MYKRALVPLDGSRAAEAILPYIERIAGPLEMEIVLIMAVSLAPEEVIGVAPRFGQDSPAHREGAAQRYLESPVTDLRTKGVRARARVALGEPAAAIVAAAREAGADLIAMTTHGRSGLGRLLFGSVAESVLRAAPIPVFLLRMTETARAATAPTTEARLSVERVLFATDFSDAALAAWPTARSLAAAFEAQVILEHVIPPLTYREDLPRETFAPYLAEARAKAERELDKLRAEAGGLKVKPRVDEGWPADQIVRAAAEERADLIVMGTMGRSGVGRVLVGSVAAHVVRVASCPVVAVGPSSQSEEPSRVGEGGGGRP